MKTVDEELNETFERYVTNLQNKYMAHPKSLRVNKDDPVVVDTEMKIPKRAINLNPDKKKSAFSTEWMRNQQLLKSSTTSPPCEKVKELLISRGNRKIKEEVLVPILKKDRELWYEKLREQGIDEKFIQSSRNKAYLNAWYKSCIFLDIFDVKTGTIIEVDGEAFHIKEIDKARDNFLKEILGAETIRVTGFKSNLPEKIDKDYNKLITFLDNNSKNPTIFEKIQRINIEYAVEDLLRKLLDTEERCKVSFPAFKTVIQILMEEYPDESWKSWKGIRLKNIDNIIKTKTNIRYCYYHMCIIRRDLEYFFSEFYNISISFV